MDARPTTPVRAWTQPLPPPRCCRRWLHTLCKGYQATRRRCEGAAWRPSHCTTPARQVRMAAWSWANTPPTTQLPHGPAAFQMHNRRPAGRIQHAISLHVLTWQHWTPAEQKHAVKVTPMARLADALAEACAKFRPPLDPATCQIHAARKPVDLQTPWRLLNLPSGARLDVVVVAGSGADSSGSGHAAAAAPASQPRPAPAAAQTAAGAGPASSSAPAGAEAAGGSGAGGDECGGGDLSGLGIERPLLVFTQRAVEAAAEERAR